jgi:hypothetical protein
MNQKGSRYDQIIYSVFNGSEEECGQRFKDYIEQRPDTPSRKHQTQPPE